MSTIGRNLDPTLAKWPRPQTTGGRLLLGVGAAVLGAALIFGRSAGQTVLVVAALAALAIMAYAAIAPAAFRDLVRILQPKPPPLDAAAAERERLRKAESDRVARLREVDEWQAEQLLGKDPNSEDAKRIRVLGARRREEIMRG